MNSPFLTLDIITSAMNRNYGVVQKSLVVKSYGDMVYIDERFLKQVNDAKKHIEVLRLMANKYYEKNDTSFS